MPSANQKTKSTLNGAKLDRLRASNFAARDVPDAELGAVLRQLAEAGAGANVGANAAPTAEDARDQRVAETFIDAVESGIEVVRTSAELARSAAFESDSESDKILTNILGEVKSLGARIMSAFSGALRGTTALDAGAGSIAGAASARAPKGQFLQGGMASKAGQIGIGVLGGLTSALGGDKVAERTIQRIVDRESFIEHETKLRSESQPEFRQLDPKAQRKVLSDEYKRAQAKKAAPAAPVESTEDFQPESTPIRQERSVIPNEVSNSGTERSASVDEEFVQEDKLRHSAEMSVQAEHTTLLAEIADILRNKTFGSGSGNNTGSADSLSLPGFGLPSPASTRVPPTPRPAGTSWWSRARAGAGTAGSKALSFGKGLLQRGAAPLAVAGGAYEGYTAYGEAGSKKADSLASIDQAEQSGEITKREADIKRAEVESQSSEDKSGAVGKGVGVAAGALLGAKAGATAGALAGSFIPVVGTAAGGVVGGLIGGTAGAIAGSSVGQNIGGALGRGYENVKSALGVGAPRVVPEASGVVGTVTASGTIASNPDLGSAAQVVTPPSAITTNSASKPDLGSAALTAPTTNSASKPEPELAFQVTSKGASSTSATLFDSTPDSVLNAESATVTKSSGTHQRIAQPAHAYLDSKDMAQMPRHSADSLRETSLAAPTVKAPNIVVQAPAPVVMPSAPQTQVINPPFFNNIRNHEASLSDYLRSRYG